MRDPITVATNELERSFSITASAGCGKTYILVSRVIALLKSGIPIKRLLLLTFSENAALEMKERIIAELKKHLDKKWAHKALDDIHNSSISTFHSFTLDICKQYSEVIGATDSLSLIDDINLKSDQKDFFDQEYNKWGDEKTFGDLTLYSYLLGIQRSAWLTFFKATYEHLEFDDGSNINLDKLQSIDYIEYKRTIDFKLEKISNAAKNVIREYSLIELENLSIRDQERYSCFHDLAQEIIASKDDADLLYTIKNTKKYIAGRTFALKKQINPIDFEIEQLGISIEENIEAICDITLKLISKLLIELSVRYRERCIAQGLISFSDAILGAKYVLKNESNNFDIWSNYDCIIVDEFQDTDIHQLEIVKILSDNSSLGDIGRLFVVGDKKQSIYKFRGVDVSKYENFVNSNNLENLTLDTSRRSTKSIISNINEIMPTFINPYEQMQSVREDFSDDQSQHFSTIGCGLNLNVPELREIQGRDIAKKIEQLIGLDIFDKEINELRKSTYSDVQILIRSRTGLNEIIQSLKIASIPFSIDSPVLLFDNRFSKVLFICLDAIANPLKPLKTIGALRTPLFNCSNDELAIFIDYVDTTIEKDKYINNYWDPINYSEKTFSSAPQEARKVWNAISKLNSLNRKSRFADPVSFLSYLLFEEGLSTAFECTTKENDINIKDISLAFLNKAIVYSKNSTERSVYDFIELLKTQRDSEKSNDKIWLQSELDAVHIMTAHTSKGLEFPIVIYVPSIRKHTKKQQTQLVILENTNSNNLIDNVALMNSRKVKDSRLNSYIDDGFFDNDDEEARIAYVALTRARDYLVVCKHHQLNKKMSPIKSDAANLSEAIDRLDIVPSLDAPIIKNIAEDNKEKVPIDISNIEERKLYFKSLLSKNLVKIEQNRVLSPGSIKNNQTSKLYLSKRPRDLSIGTAIGSATHRALNLIDFKNVAENVIEVCKKCAIKEGVFSHYEEVVFLVNKALETKTIMGINRNHFRELPIYGNVQGTAYSGFIDLLIEKDDHYLIVDYKTDTISKQNSVHSKIEKYASQIAMYSILLKQRPQIKKTRAIFLFLNSKENIEFEVEDLADREQKLLI